MIFYNKAACKTMELEEVNNLCGISLNNNSQFDKRQRIFKSEK